MYLSRQLRDSLSWRRRGWISATDHDRSATIIAVWGLLPWSQC